jgi:hypothetical protein
MFHLTQRTPSSYRCSDRIAVAVWLTEQGYQVEPPRSAYEYMRLRKKQSLLVVYENGTVLLQGSDTDAPRALFAPMLASQPVNEMLPF